MLEAYKRMYATVVGCADTSIDELEDIASQEVCDKQRILGVAGRLRLALWDAEDIYLDAEEGTEEDTKETPEEK